MDLEHNKALVLRLLDEVVGRGHMAVLDEICAPDVINHAAAPDRRHGIENLREILEFTRAAQPDQRWVEQRLVAEGDFVVAFGRREGTWRAASFRGFATAQDIAISVELAHLWRVHGGKIVEHWAVRDDLGMMQQLGAI